jgi:single-strand DNA-binding protein
MEAARHRSRETDPAIPLQLEPLKGRPGFTKVDDDPFAGNGQIDISDDDLPF